MLFTPDDEDAPHQAGGSSLDLVAEIRGGSTTALRALILSKQAQLERAALIRASARIRARASSRLAVLAALEVAAARLGEVREESEAGVLSWFTERLEDQLLLGAEDGGSGQARSTRRACARPVRAPAASRELLASSLECDALPVEREWFQRLRAALDEATHQLPTVEREAVLLRDFCQVPWDEVGEELGLEEAQARSTHRQAWASLRGELQRRIPHLLGGRSEGAVSRQAAGQYTDGEQVEVCSLSRRDEENPGES